MNYCKPVFYAIILLVILSISNSCSPKNSSKEETKEFKPQPIILEKQDVKTLEIGDPMPEFNLPDMNGNWVNDKDFKKAELLVVIFTCNHCPTAQAYEDRMIQFTAEYQNRGVQVAAIMPTSSSGLLLEECGYTEYDDSFEHMKSRAIDKGYNFPYLYDGDDQAVSISFGPTTTPHVFVFDKERKLQYVGRLDAFEKPGSANAEDLRNAVEEILSGVSVTIPVTKTFGCSIKWSWKSDWTQKVNKEWSEKEVDLQTISDKEIEVLLANDTEKLRLINVWATWCAPCVIELPDLINLQRMYGGRAFEFITLSADKPEKKNDVLKLLTEKHSPISNYIFNQDDQYRLIELIDPEWSGSLPYSILIEPGGKVIYKSNGIVDYTELKKIIVEHPLIGRYF